MYGLVNKAVEDLVVTSEGIVTWERIKAHAGLEDLQLLDTSNYEDEITYRLVGSASAILEKTTDVVLHAFGRHWVLYTGRQGWANLFAASGDDLVSFLKNLDEMHARFNTAMPEGRMPEFSLAEHESGYLLEYRSEREGLAPMVMGILAGLAEQFEEEWCFEHLDKRDQYGFDRFQLTRVIVPLTSNLHHAA